MKTCTKCGEAKALDAFSREARAKDGLRSRCRTCDAGYQRSRYAADRERIRGQQRRWYEANRAKVAEKQRRWERANPHLVNAQIARRKAAKLQRTPPWLTAEHHAAIAAIYAKAKEIEALVGLPVHVDHVVPLQGDNVSGLHVPWNLQVMLGWQNSSKSNRLEE